MLHGLLRYVGFANPSMGDEAQTLLDAAFQTARRSNPALWAKPSHHIPTRQAKFEAFCLCLAPQMPAHPSARRAVLEAAITRLEYGLREAGVGDLGVAKEIRTLAGALHGRLKAYEKYIQDNDFTSFIQQATQHGVAAATVQAAWPHPLKKPLPKRQKAANGAKIDRNSREPKD